MTVADLGTRMSAREFVWWQAFYALEAKEYEARNDGTSTSMGR